MLREKEIRTKLNNAYNRESSIVKALESKGYKTGKNLIDYELGRKDGIKEALMIVENKDEI